MLIRRNKPVLLGVGAAVLSMLLAGCTCPACRGAGLQHMVTTYQTSAGGPYYTETATIACLSCGGSGQNWSSWLGFTWLAGGALHAIHDHHHGGSPPHGGPPPHGPRRH